MTNYEKLINTLKEVFMLDKAELDFGIYRIMNQKRKDIEQFLEVDLVPQVQKVLGESLSIDKQSIQKELAEAIKSAHALGADPDSLPKVQQLKVRLGEAADLVGLENEVFSLLANFFRRYFDNGDFISMRRYKKDVYSIPYEGEEVKLHWANADQYYIKTSEYFKNYRFKLNNGKSVVFELIEASTEQNNNKTQGDKERRFALYAENSCEQVGDEFKIYFTYEPIDKKEKQSDLLAEVFDTIKTRIPQDFLDLLSLRPTEKEKQRTLLQKHLLDYTARNTFDYFIHKDLDGFLTRELDFYIKNEVLFIDDLNTRDEQEFLKQLSKIKAVKKIGEKIITFLAQIENFQKKLWLKKKMVVECNYCITLDRVSEVLYPEIATNQAQINEWIRLFSIDEIKEEKSGGLFPSEKKGFSNPLTIDFLKQNPFLVLDTVFFNEIFKWKIITSIENFDEQCDGLLINSDNFQALKLIETRYKESVKTIFIDPPYNTENDRQTGKFIYKDGFSDSSWISMMFDRVLNSYSFLNKKGLFFCTIDDNELFNLKLLCDSIFNPSNFKANIIWNSRKSKQNDIDVSLSHNYITLYSKNKSKLELYGQPLIESEFDNPDNDIKGKWKVSPLDAPGVRERTSFFPIINPNSNEEYYPPKGRHWTVFEEDVPELIEEGRIFFGIRGNTKPQWKRYWEEVKEDSKTIGTIWDELDTATNATKELENILGHKNFETPKPSNLLEEIIQQSTSSNELIIDYFSGSGTTAHAVIKKKRQGINAKYILCEMGDYFDRITKERVIKVIYSKEWRNGKPVNSEGISHCFKYIRLESYEDTLNNLEIKRSTTQQQVLDMNPSFKEGYMLNYMLDVETQGSLLNLDWFENPYNCYLNISRNNELQATKVDLVETFNYLIGLVVEHYAVPKDGYVVVTGKNLAGESILVVWRDCTLHNSASLNEFLSKSKYNPLDNEFDRIYVNGDNNVENLKIGDERWKVVLIEEEFKTRMFENN
jgi:adenine-specific DNA-methyltransferase